MRDEEITTEAEEEFISPTFGMSYDCTVCMKNFQKTKYSVEYIIQGGRIGSFAPIMQPN